MSGRSSSLFRLDVLVHVFDGFFNAHIVRDRRITFTISNQRTRHPGRDRWFCRGLAHFDGHLALLRDREAVILKGELFLIAGYAT